MKTNVKTPTITLVTRPQTTLKRLSSCASFEEFEEFEEFMMFIVSNVIFFEGSVQKRLTSDYTSLVIHSIWGDSRRDSVFLGAFGECSSLGFLYHKNHGEAKAIFSVNCRWCRLTPMFMKGSIIACHLHSEIESGDPSCGGGFQPAFGQNFWQQIDAFLGDLQAGSPHHNQGVFRDNPMARSREDGAQRNLQKIAASPTPLILERMENKPRVSA